MAIKKPIVRGGAMSQPMKPMSAQFGAGSVAPMPKAPVAAPSKIQKMGVMREKLVRKAKKLK